MKPKSSVDRGHEPARVCAKIERQRTIDNMGLAPLQRGDNHSEKNDKRVSWLCQNTQGGPLHHTQRKPRGRYDHIGDAGRRPRDPMPSRKYFPCSVSDSSTTQAGLLEPPFCQEANAKSFWYCFPIL